MSHMKEKLDKTNNYEFYYKVACVLSEKTKYERFDPTDIQQVDIDGEMYSIGPFEEINTLNGWCDDIWAFGFPGSDYIIYMSEEDWSSWGHHYDDEGNNFSVLKRKNPKTIIQYEYDDIYENLPEEVTKKYKMPARSRW